MAPAAELSPAEKEGEKQQSDRPPPQEPQNRKNDRHGILACKCNEHLLHSASGCQVPLVGLRGDLSWQAYALTAAPRRPRARANRRAPAPPGVPPETLAGRVARHRRVRIAKRRHAPSSRYGARPSRPAGALLAALRRRSPQRRGATQRRRVRRLRAGGDSLRPERRPRTSPSRTRAQRGRIRDRLGPADPTR